MFKTVFYVYIDLFIYLKSLLFIPHFGYIFFACDIIQVLPYYLFKELLQRIKFCLLPSENFHHPRQNMRKFFETNIMITLYHQQHTCTSITLWEKQWHRNVKKYANMYICDNIFHDTMYTQIPCNYFLFKLSWISKILFWWNISNTLKFCSLFIYLIS